MSFEGYLYMMYNSELGKMDYYAMSSRPSSSIENLHFIASYKGINMGAFAKMTEAALNHTGSKDELVEKVEKFLDQ